MTTENNHHFQKLLTTFDAIGLGEGDRIAGGNLLAAMAITLANISRTGSGIGSPGLGRMRAGMSALVSGSLSSSLINDDVVREVAINQNNLSAQLQRLFGDKLADARKNGLTSIEFPSGPKANPSENALFQLEQKESLVTYDVQDKWAEALHYPPNPRIEDLAARPKVFVTATCAADLERQLVGLHGSRPLVVLGLNRPADAAALGDTCTAIMDGRFPAGPLGETAAGNLLITDPGDVLTDVAKSADDKAAWLGRLLWLVDGDAGPEPPGLAEGEIEVRLVNMAERFATALNQAFAARLNNHDAGSKVHELDLAAAQFRWVKFLKGMEKDLPGICGTARGLLATLSFGLLELGRTKGCDRLEVNVEGIEAFARHLVLRMAKARAAILFSADEARKLKDMRRIFCQLGGGQQMRQRDIYRNLTILAPYCGELLLEMETGGLVRRTGDTWEKAEGATISDLPTHRLIKKA